MNNHTHQTPSGQRPLVVGLIGGIGSGKSAVAAELARQSGGQVIEADALGHEALRQPAIREEVVRQFGKEILEEQGEQIDRRKLAGVVFGDPKALKQLEAISHPWIRQRVQEEVALAGKRGTPLVVLDAALLLEAGWDSVCDRLVFVDAPEEVRRQRVLARPGGWTEKDWQEREAAQLPLTEKRVRADHVLDNTSANDRERLRQQVADLLQRHLLNDRGMTTAVAAPTMPERLTDH